MAEQIKMQKALEDVFEDKARAGDGQFAVAFALLKLAKSHEKLATKVAQLGYDGPGGNPGAFEYVGMQLRDIKNALDPLIVNASVDLHNA